MQYAADSGWRDASGGRDLLAGPTLPTQPFDLLDDRLRRRLAQSMGP
jgi:hypothetical protein